MDRLDKAKEALEDIIEAFVHVNGGIGGEWQSELKQAQKSLAELQDFIEVLNSNQVMGFLEWLSLDHKVSTATKDRSDFWAGQFKWCIGMARTTLSLMRGDNGDKNKDW